MSLFKKLSETAADMAESKYSPKAEESIGSKMHLMKDEDRPQNQKVAIALSYARKKGLKVPGAPTNV